MDELVLIAGHLCLVRENDGTVVLDLGTGACHTPNLTALAFFVLVEEGRSFGDAAVAVAAAAQVSPGLVARDMEALLAHLGDQGLAPATCTTPFRFVEMRDGFVLYRGTDPVLHLGFESGRIERLCDPRAANLDPFAALFYAGPQALALAGQPMLHAAAVERDGRALAFLGPSGAGKTTTAHVFVRAGSQLIAEDVLPVVLGGPELKVLADGEQAIAAWAREARAAFCSAQGVVSTGSLRAAVQAGTPVVLGEAWLLDAARRSGTEFRPKPLPRAQAVVHLLANGLGAPRSYHRGLWKHLDMVSSVVRACPVREVTVPYGTGLLEEAAQSSIDAVPGRSAQVSMRPTRRELFRAAPAAALLAALAASGYASPTLAWDGQFLAQGQGGSGGACPPRRPNCLRRDDDPVDRRGTFVRLLETVAGRIVRRRS